VNDELYEIQPLGNQNRAAFSCGEEELDRYFRQQAGQDQRRNVASCFLFIRSADMKIVGYFTLSATAVGAEELPESVIRRLPRYPNLPAILLGRLAVDQEFHGQGFGRRLLIAALRTARDATSQVAAVVVVVEALHETAARFYEAFGFSRFNDTPLRLFIPVASIRDL
jgi:GNAT superfamily N-acetyltransferase